MRFELHEKWLGVLVTNSTYVNCDYFIINVHAKRSQYATTERSSCFLWMLSGMFIRAKKETLNLLFQSAFF